MAYFELKVSSENTDTIEFKVNNDEDKGFSSVKFKMNTIDNDVKGRATGIRAEFLIKGVINDSTKNEVQKLAAWAITKEEEELYRSIEIVVKNNESQTAKVLRRYVFSDMFVVDYKESFGKDTSANNIGKFKLFVAQKASGTSRKVLPN